MNTWVVSLVVTDGVPGWCATVPAVGLSGLVVWRTQTLSCQGDGRTFSMPFLRCQCDRSRQRLLLFLLSALRVLPQPQHIWVYPFQMHSDGAMHIRVDPPGPTFTRARLQVRQLLDFTTDTGAQPTVNLRRGSVATFTAFDAQVAVPPSGGVATDLPPWDAAPLYATVFGGRRPNSEGWLPMHQDVNLVAFSVELEVDACSGLFAGPGCSVPVGQLLPGMTGLAANQSLWALRLPATVSALTVTVASTVPGVNASLWRAVLPPVAWLAAGNTTASYPPGLEPVAAAWAVSDGVRSLNLSGAWAQWGGREDKV